MKRSNLLLASMLTLSAVCANAAEITQLLVRQQWPWSPLVTIDYTLGNAAMLQDIDVTLTANGQTIPVDRAAFSGDLYVRANSQGRIIFDPAKSGQAALGIVENVVFTLTPSDSSVENLEVLYKIISLSDGAMEDVTRGSLLNGDYGSVVKDFGEIGEGYQTSLSDVLVWTGVTNNPAYMSDYLVMRKIPAGTFGMGINASLRDVTFTNDFWIAVFEMTQGQWAKVTGSAGSSAMKQGPSYPVGRVTYDTLRGATNANQSVSINWPGTAHQVGADSFIGKLRGKTNGLLFDLPTEAQWEYACRAGTATYYHDGQSGTPPPTGSWGNSNGWLSVLGRYRENGGYTNGIVVGEVKCGSYRPNAYGLYDMHGNEMEWCLDWFTGSLGTSSATEPAGPLSPDSGAGRILRGGSWYVPANQCTSDYRGVHNPPTSNGSSNGFRVVLRFE